jgi:hypothetical protein
MSETETQSRVEQITVRMTEAEKNLAAKLGVYLYRYGKLDEPSVAGALRMALRFTVQELLKEE